VLYGEMKMLMVLVCDLEHFKSMFGQTSENIHGCSPLKSLHR